MTIGAFSVSLAVKNLAASKAFYEKLGFSVAGGDTSQNWLIMRNDDCTIGLFQGMLSQNTLTFNPGWNAQADNIDPFKDIRVIHDELVAKRIDIIDSTNLSGEGPAHIFIMDPDGNPILIDQHR